MDALITFLVTAAMAALFVANLFWMWSIWDERMKKEQRRKEEAKHTLVIETVCDACGSSMFKDGGYKFRGRYLCGKCLKRTINSIKVEDKA